MRNRLTAIVLMLLLTIALLPRTARAGGSPPVAVRDSYVASVGVALSISAGTGLLINDSDPDSDTISVANYTLPAHGTVTVVTNGAFTYTPNAGFAGTDTFTYDIKDTTLPVLISSFVAVTINVIRSRPPVAEADNYIVPENTTLTIPAAKGLLINDVDPNGDSLLVDSFSLPAHGTASIVTNGAFTYTPNTNYLGADSFIYRIKDSNGLFSAYVTVTLYMVSPGGSAPVAVPDSYATLQNAVLTVSAAAGLLTNDFDPNGNPFTVDSFSVPANGTVSVVTNGVFTYTPNNNFVGTDSFTYRIKDSTALTSTFVTVTITILPGSNVDTIGVFRPSSTTFYLRTSNTTGNADLQTTFGASSDLPIVGDWDGDGIDTIGVFRPSTAQFFLTNSNTQGAPVVYSLVLGNPGDLPMAGDWDGNGADGVGVFRPSNGLIYLKNGLTTGFADFQMVLGSPGDAPVTGDWDGNGADSPGVYRPSSATFFLTNSVCNCAVTATYQLTLGVSGDTPFAGDWDGNGFSGVGVFRPSNGLIYLKNALTTGFADINIVFGIANDKPVAGHWAVGSGNSIRNTAVRVLPAVQPTPQPSNTSQPKIAPTFVP